MSAVWRKALTENLVPFEELAEKFHCDSDPLRQVIGRYPFRLTRHYYNLIEQVDDPLWRQVVPDQRELLDEAQLPDPLNEAALSPVPGLIHRYPDRVVWLVSNECPVYCRFCMRKRMVGCGNAETSSGQRKAALGYIASTPAIRDVVLSGGDPLLLDDDDLAEILTELRRIPHVEIIRIGSRVPVTLPRRITPKLCRLLKQFHPIYLNTHFNHSLEITSESARACAMLADAGIPLGNQTVLLKGVNDDPAIMKDLMINLLRIRVKPYYIHQMDLVRGTGHFRTPVSTGIAVMEALRGHVSGLATPYFVVDLPGGNGKVPLLPDTVRREGDTLQIRNYLGTVTEYPDLPSMPVAICAELG